MVSTKIIVQGIEIVIFQQKDNEFISLTDIARSKNPDFPRYVIQNWMKTRSTVDFLGIWEQIYNSHFNRVEFDAVRQRAGTNSFVLTPHKWVKQTGAIGIVSRSGRYGGGTFAHKDIAFEFATWVSPEFKLYLIKEFQRLKEEESERKALDWNVKRILTKINYKIQTDAIKDYLIPVRLSKGRMNTIYADEGDILNLALFGMTAKEWRERHQHKQGNMRDYANVTQLVCLAALESINAEFIRQGLPQSSRLQRLNEIAIIQMKSIQGHSSIQKLKKE